MKKGIGIGVLLLVIILMGIGVYSLSSDKIAKNVYVKDVNIGKLTKDEAKDKIIKEYHMEPFKFNYQDDEWIIESEKVNVTYDIDKTIENAYNVNRNSNIFANIFKSIKSTIGFKTKVNVVVDFDKDKLNKELEKISEDINVEVKNATLDVKDDKVKVVKEKTGLELDRKSSIENFVKTLQSGIFEEELVVTKIEPEVRSSDLKNIDTLLGSYSTVLSDRSAGRVENIKLAAKKTSDVLLMPGEEFSYNEHTGIRNAENGYKNAAVISGGKVVDGLGGGVCQVSSTMFNTVLYAGLDIVSRTNHSIRSSYVPLGRDATVTDGAIDFVFRNGHKNPVFIKNYYSNGRITCQIFGVKSDKQKIEIQTSINATIPYGVREKSDSTLKEGERKILERGRTGYKVTTYRIFYDKNGKVVKKETVCSSYYPKKDEEVAVGTQKVEEQKPEEGQNPGENPGQGPGEDPGTTPPTTGEGGNSGENENV